MTHAFPYVKSDLVPLLAYQGPVPGVRELLEARRQAQAARTRDALGTLYVAMTRARYALDMMVPWDPEKGPPSGRTHADILCERLAPDADPAEVEVGDPLFRRGDPDWYRRLPPPPTSATRDRAERPLPVTLRSATSRIRSLERRTPSGEEGGKRVQIDDVLGLGGGEEGRQRGIVVHAWLERLEWLEQGLPPDDELIALAMKAAPAMERPRLHALLEWLRTRLQLEPIRAELSRTSWPGESVVERELPFLLREDDALVEGIVDRLVLEREGDRVVRATVLDFKTDFVDTEGAAQLEERVGYYAPQILAYKKAVATLYGLGPTDVRGRLLFLEPGLVREV